MRPSPVSPVVDGQECRLDIPVQPVQVDVGEQRAQNSALWRTTQRLVVAPILQISGLKQSVDQAQEPAVVDLLGQDRSQGPGKVVEGEVRSAVMEGDTPHE